MVIKLDVNNVEDGEAGQMGNRDASTYIGARLAYNWYCLRIFGHALRSVPLHHLSCFTILLRYIAT